MFKSIKFGVGATLLAAAQLSTAASADVQISNITLSVSGGEWWYWLPGNVDWLAMTAGTSVNLLSPAASDGATGWHGTALASSVTNSGSLASATLTAATSGDVNGATAAAHVLAGDGQSGWAFAKVFDGQIMVGANATITLSATINTITASGTSAQANAYIDLCSTDFTTDVCAPANSAEAFVDGLSGSYSGPSILTASWTNPGATTWAKMHFGLTASAVGETAPVPEPAPWAMALTGLAVLGALGKRLRAK